MGSEGHLIKTFLRSVIISTIAVNCTLSNMGAAENLLIVWEITVRQKQVELKDLVLRKKLFLS